jgi:hypothetical protein
MARRIHNWDELERRWILGEWKTLEEMSKSTKISILMIQKNSSLRKWRDKRQQVEDEGNTEALRRLGLSLGKKIAAANSRALNASKVLMEKGLRRFVDGQGKLTKGPIESDAAAITAIRAAIAIEQAILKNQQLDGTPESTTTNTEITLFAQQNNYSTGEMSDEQLTAVIRETDKRIRQLEPSTTPIPAKTIRKSPGAKKKRKK